MSNPLPNLKIDTVFKGVIAVSSVVLIVSLTIGNTATALIALGFLFIGFGEWINHPERSGVVPASAYHPGMIVTSTSRRPSPFGWCVDLAGAILIMAGTYHLL